MALVLLLVFSFGQVRDPRERHADVVPQQAESLLTSSKYLLSCDFLI